MEQSGSCAHASASIIVLAGSNVQIAGNGKTFPPPRRWKTEATNPTTKQGPLHGVCHSSPLVAVHHQAKTQSSASTRTTATSARGCFLLAFALRPRPRPPASIYTANRAPATTRIPVPPYLSIDRRSLDPAPSLPGRLLQFFLCSISCSRFLHCWRARRAGS